MVVVLVASITALVVAGSHHGTPPPASSAFPPPERIPNQTLRLHQIQGGRVAAWALPVALSGPADVAVGSDGTVWAAEQSRGAMDGFDPATGTDVRYLFQKAFPQMGSMYSLATDPSGAVWFAGWPDEPFGRLLPDGTGNAFGSGGEGLATGDVAPDQTGAMWVAYTHGSRLLRAEPDGHLTYVAVPKVGGKPGSPTYLAAGPDSMWFTMGDNDAVGMVPLSDPQQVSVYDMPPHSAPFHIATASDGSHWVTLALTKQLAHVRTDGTYDVVPVHAASAQLEDVVVAPDGSLWVSQVAPWVLHLDASGTTIERVELPPPLAEANGLAIAPDGSVWGASQGGNAIFRIAPTSR